MSQGLIDGRGASLKLLKIKAHAGLSAWAFVLKFT